MSIFNKIQTCLNEIIELHKKIEHLKGRIINKKNYIGERLVGEEEYEKIIQTKRHDEEHNKKIEAEITTTTSEYNQKFDELCSLVEPNEGALSLPGGLVLVHSGKTFEVYSHDTEYKIAQSHNKGQSQFRKPEPDVYKRL